LRISSSETELANGRKPKYEKINNNSCAKIDTYICMYIDLDIPAPVNYGLREVALKIPRNHWPQMQKRFLALVSK